MSTSISIFLLHFLLFYVYVQDYRTHLRYLTPLFQGLHLLQQAASLCKEASHLEVAGLQKVKLALVGSSAEGLYGLLWGILSHTSSPVAMPPSGGINGLPLLPWLSHPLKSLKLQFLSPQCLWLRGCTGTGSSPFSCSSGSGGCHPCKHDTPSC